MADIREFIIAILGKESATPVFGKVEDGLDDLGKQAKKTEQDFDGLDKKLKDHADTIGHLRQEIAKTGDTKLFPELNKNTRGFDQLTKLRKMLTDQGEPAATGFYAKFFGKLGPLMASMPISGPMGIGIAAGVAILAPTIGGAIAGAIVGAAGVGGVVGGVVLASKDPRVKAAASDLKTEIGMELKDAAEPFVPATIAAIDKARVAFAVANTDIKGIFADSADYLDPLVGGATDGARKFVGGFATAVSKAGPVVDQFGRSFDRIGDTAGQVFALLADDADEGASAIDDVTTATVNFIKTTAGVVHNLAEVKGGFDGLDKQLDRFRYYLEDGASKSHTFTEGLDLTADGFKKGSVEAEAYRRTTLGIATDADYATLRLAAMTEEERNAEVAAKALAVSQDLVSGAMGQAAFVADKYRQALLDQVDGNISAAEASLRYRQSVVAAAEAVDHKRKVSLEEESALLSLAKSTNAATLATDDNTESAGVAKQRYEAATQAFITTAVKMGYTREEAAKLSNELLKIPKKVATKVILDQWPAITAVRNIQKAINGLHGKTIRNTIITGEFGGNDIGARHGMSEGGLVGGGGPPGKDTQVRVLASDEYVLTGKEVRQAGGPGGIKSALSGGGTPMAAQQRSGGGGSLVLQIAPGRFSGLERMFLSWLKEAIGNAGGNTVVLGY